MSSSAEPDGAPPEGGKWRKHGELTPLGALVIFEEEEAQAERPIGGR